MTAADLLAKARNRHRGAARAYARNADGPGREAALANLERAAVVAVMAAAASTGMEAEIVDAVLEAAKKGLGL